MHRPRVGSRPRVRATPCGNRRRLRRSMVRRVTRPESRRRADCATDSEQGSRRSSRNPSDSPCPSASYERNLFLTTSGSGRQERRQRSLTLCRCACDKASNGSGKAEASTPRTRMQRLRKDTDHAGEASLVRPIGKLIGPTRRELWLATVGAGDFHVRPRHGLGLHSNDRERVDGEEYGRASLPRTDASCVANRSRTRRMDKNRARRSRSGRTRDRSLADRSAADHMPVCHTRTVRHRNRAEMTMGDERYVGWPVPRSIEVGACQE